MKKLVLILTMCIMHFLSYAQEPVFAYDNNQIKSKPQFIEAFNNGNFDNITSHSLQKSYNVSALNGDKYIVKCFKNAGWENEPGDWHYLEIAYNGQTIYSIDYADGWEYLSPNLKSSLSPMADAFYQKDLDCDTVMLLFTGITIMSQPPYITVIILKKGKATLVLNKPFFIEKVQHSNNEDVFSLCANTVEYYDNGTPMNNASIQKLYVKNKMIFISNN